MASSNINEKVQQALEEGHAWEDIKAHLGTLDNPEAKSYLEGLKATSQQLQNPQRDTLTKGLDWVQENPKEALGYGAALYGATQLPKIVSGIADYRLEKRKVDLKERSLAAYEAQVAKQGLPVAESLNLGDDLINNVRQNEINQQKPTAPSVQDQIAQERLKQAQLKTQRAEAEHQNWLAKNTLSEAEQAFGRKAKDPNELRLMQAAVQQQAGKSPIAPTPAGPAPMAELPVVTSPAANAPVVPTNVAPATAAPPVTPVETTPVITQPANVVSTGPTPEAAAAPIKEAEVVKKAVIPTSAKAPVEPTTFRADLGPGDNWLFNTAGPEKRKAILKEFNEGKPAGSYDEAQKLWAKYVESRRQTFEGPEMTKEVRKERGIPPRENFGQLGKVTKVAGVAGLALTAAQMAQAAEAAKKGDTSLAKELGFDLGTGLGMAKLMGGPAALAASLALGSKGLNADEEKQLAYLRKVGTGRGIAPPSAYMR